MMKHALATIGALALFAVSANVQAATIGFSPATLSVTEGQNFSVTVSVDPSGTRAYAVQLAATFSADVVEATGITLESGWMAPGSVSINNSAGTLSHMAGIGGGFDTKKTLGTISFRAKKSGTATIGVSNSTVVSNAQGGNALSGTQGASVVSVASPAPAVAQTPAAETPAETLATKPEAKPAAGAKPAIGTGASTEASSAQAGEEENGTGAATATEQATEQAAAVIIGGNAIPVWLLILAALAILGGGGWYFYRWNTAPASL